MEHLVERYVPVGEAEVLAAVTGGAALPHHAVWVTFDDGDPSVVTNGLPTLTRLGIQATMFVCPGLIASGEPFWWRLSDGVEPATAQSVRDQVAAASELDVDLGGLEITEALKLVDDRTRRKIIGDLASGSEPSDKDDWRQLDSEEIDRWRAAGMSLGNHSWDHPCLDQCDPEEQVRQIRDAHAWLFELLGEGPRSFAYPNGNHSRVVEEVLVDLGYELAVLHDNRIATSTAEPLMLSRLRVEADEPTDRLASVASGAQATLVQFGSWIPVSS